MPQLVKKRRSGWAVLAAGALVASLLAVGAAPAAAGEQRADAQATWTACLGPAKAGNGFTDVSVDSVHYDNIRCLAYYGITIGRTADTYGPGSAVTRSQMALFLTRAARVADVELEDAMDMGFTDLGTTGADRVAAINRLAASDIMPGRTDTTFDPEGTVTRADMALHLFRLLDLALDEVLIDVLPKSADGDDGDGRIELNDFDGDGAGSRVDDYFGDVRRTLPAHMDDIIGAVYELGVTTGTNNVVGERGTFAPDRPVTRAQMASFIMRALGHTNLRPKGLTAQQTFSETQVSVRDDDFAPVVNARAEVFRSNFASSAFNRSGRCIDRYVTDSSPSFDACVIDSSDARTDVEGNVELKPGYGGGSASIICAAGTPYAVGGDDTVRYFLDAPGLVDPEADYKLWAWTGGFGDEVDSDTDLFEAVPANQLSGRSTAAAAVFSGGALYDVKMGSALVYEIQLVDDWGMPVGPNPAGNQDYIVTVSKHQVDISGAYATGTQKLAESYTRSPDSNGNIRIVVANPDPVIGTNGNDVAVTVKAERSAGTSAQFNNNLRFVDSTGATDTIVGTADVPALNKSGFDEDGHVMYEAQGSGTGPNSGRRIIGAQAPVETFSDDPPTVTSIDVSPILAARVLESSRNRNSIGVTVLDQYGDPYRGGAVYIATSSVARPAGGPPAASQFPNNGNGPTSAMLSSDRAGRISFSYNYQVGEGVETVSIAPSPTGGTAGQATVYWSNIPNPGDGNDQNLLLADPRGRRLIADVKSDTDTSERPAALLYGADDEFLVGVGGTPLSLEQFQEVLSDPQITLNNSDADGDIATLTTLSWLAFNNNRPNDRARWTLAGLHCTPPPGADAEIYL